MTTFVAGHRNHFFGTHDGRPKRRSWGRRRDRSWVRKEWVRSKLGFLLRLRHGAGGDCSEVPRGRLAGAPCADQGRGGALSPLGAVGGLGEASPGGRSRGRPACWAGVPRRRRQLPIPLR
eukprot:9057199-Pyramimonas_sp.AAC.1